jgi:DNA modification methylase
MRKQDVLGKRTYSGFNERYDAAGPTSTRNKRDVWTVPTCPFPGAHFATFPPALIDSCVLAGCPEGGVVLDPFMGSGTVGEVAIKHNRDVIGFELNADYIRDFAQPRIEAAKRCQSLAAYQSGQLSLFGEAE